LAEAVGAGYFTAEDGTASSLAASSLCTSSSSSESLRMMTLPLPDGPRTARLRSPKSLLVNSLSHEVSGMRPSSSEDEDNPPLGPSWKDHLAQTPVSADGVRKSLTRTPMAVEIKTALAEVSSHRSMRKSPPLKESMSA
jgi:hypothetical protein